MTGQASGRTTTTWSGRLRTIVPDALRKRSRAARRSRGAAELSVLAVTGSLVAGVFFGQGISGTAVDLADGLTWLGDDPHGQIIQVNPATGNLEVKQLVGHPGNDVDVQGEYGGQMYVADHTSGRLMAFDLTSILVSGQRRISTGGVVDTIYNDDGVFLVDSEQSTISAMDPLTTEAIGTIWVAPAGLADAAVDGEGTIWALEDDGALHRLDWNTETLAFDDDEETVGFAGGGSVLVAHDEGVTVFGPDTGRVTQVGTDDELDARAPKVIGRVLAPEKSPPDLVPAASDNGYVVIVTPRGILEVDMDSIGCPDPGTPEVFRDQVWVPCLGEARVVRLGPDGRRADDDIETPGSDDPELVLDDDNLIINTPGSAQGIVIRSDGSRTTIVREDATMPANDLTSTVTPPVEPAEELIEEVLDAVDPLPEPDPVSTTPPAGGSPSTEAPPTGGPPTGGPPRNPDETCDPSGDASGAGSDAGTKDKDKGGKGKGRRNGGREACPRNPPPGGGAGQQVTAPTDVVATPIGEGRVEVAWYHSGIPKADAFVVRSSTGATYPPNRGTANRAYVDVTPGVPTSFTVTAILGARQEVSDPSETVVSTARPGAPKVAAVATYEGNDVQERFVVAVAWSGAAANGEAITSYDVQVTTPQGTLSQPVAATRNTLELTWTCSYQQDPACRVGGDYQVVVVARSVLGSGQPGHFAGIAPAQPPPPLPDGGRQHVTTATPRTDAAADDGSGSIDLRLRPPTDWARFPGSCTFTLDDGSPQPVACNATTLTIAYQNGPAVQPDDGVFEHTVIFQAANDRGAVASAPWRFTTRQTVYAPGPPPEEPVPGGPGEPYPDQPPSCYPQTCHLP